MPIRVRCAGGVWVGSNAGMAVLHFSWKLERDLASSQDFSLVFAQIVSSIPDSLQLPARGEQSCWRVTGEPVPKLGWWHWGQYGAWG